MGGVKIAGDTKVPRSIFQIANLKATYLGRVQHGDPESDALLRDIEALDRVMHLLAPDFDASTIRPVRRMKNPSRPGTLMRPLLEILRRAGDWMPRSEICKQFCAKTGMDYEKGCYKVRCCLTHMQQEGLVESLRKDKQKHWRLARKNQAANGKLLSLAPALRRKR